MGTGKTKEVRVGKSLRSVSKAMGVGLGIGAVWVDLGSGF